MKVDEVRPAQLYRPRIVVTTWFRTWALKCGACRRNFHRFALFGKPCCPWCGVRNVPLMEIGP